MKKKTTSSVPVGFAPAWICEAQARLVMNNPATNEVFDYDLHGIGEEPMALDHLIINGVARSTTKHDIALKNPYSDRPITYDVETDLAGASGPVSVTIPPGKKVTYSLSITPVLSG